MDRVRSSHLLTILVATALVGACGSEAGPSPSLASPIASLSPSPIESSPSSPTASPSASVSAAETPTPSPSDARTPLPTASPGPSPSGTAGQARTYEADGDLGDVLFAPDGRIVLVERDWERDQSRVVTLDEHGTVLPGWPWSPGDTGNPIADAVLGPEGSVYVAVRSAQGVPQTYGWTLHRLDPVGRELPGFPVKLPDVPFCDMAVADDGVVYVLCQAGDEDGGANTTAVRAIDPAGSTLPGWPITLNGGGAIAGFRPDGAVVVAPGYEPPLQITVIDRDGTTAAGWPRKVPDRVENVVVDRQGRVHVTSYTWAEGQCAPAKRTTYSVLRQDGKKVSGWPVTIRGWASEPLIASDGTSAIVTGSGRAIRYGRDGRILDGWPVRGVGVAEACFDGSVPVSAGADGAVVVGEGKATLLTPGGRVARGWPVKLPYRAATDCEGCTPGPAGPMSPAVGEKGIYVAAYGPKRPRIVAIDRAGQLPKGWQKAVGKKGDVIAWIRVAPTGHVWVALTRYVDATETTVGLLVPVGNDRPLQD